MADILIRDIPDETLSAIDMKARRLGLSRNEYLRRQMLVAAAADAAVNTRDLKRFTESFADLADPAEMHGAWE